jgi:predicted RNase H-like HicB family nuclease
MVSRLNDELMKRIKEAISLCLEVENEESDISDFVAIQDCCQNF